MLKIKAKDFSLEIKERFIDDFTLQFNPDWSFDTVDLDDPILPWNKNPEQVFFLEELEQEAENYFWDHYNDLELRTSESLSLVEFISYISVYPSP